MDSREYRPQNNFLRAPLYETALLRFINIQKSAHGSCMHFDGFGHQCPFQCCIWYMWIWASEKVYVRSLSKWHTVALCRTRDSRRKALIPTKSFGMGQFHVIGMEIHLELAGRLIWTHFKACESLLVAVTFGLKELCRLIIDTMLCLCAWGCECVSLCVYVRFTCWFRLLLNFVKRFLFNSREAKGGRKKGRKTSMCGSLSHAPSWGPGLQPRHVPWLGIELATLWFAGQHSIHWATPARAVTEFLHREIKSL